MFNGEILEALVSFGNELIEPLNPNTKLTLNPARSPDKQLVSSRPDCSPDLAKSNGLTRTHVSSLSNGSNGDAEYLEQRR